MRHIRPARRLLLFVLALAMLSSVLLPVSATEGIEDTYPAPASATKIVFGASGEGRDLCAYRFGSGKNVLVIGFAMHGFEDNFDRDGECLVYAAQKLMEQLAGQKERLLRQDWTVYVLPCMNPDGLNSGTSKNGPGRCTTTFYNAEGILSQMHGVDINRCFPTDWKKTQTNRNYTGDHPLACQEAEALAAFIEGVKGGECNLLIDVHGWEQSTITFDGEEELLAETFADFFPQNTYTCATDAPGYFTNYVHSLGYEACLFNFPKDVSSLSAFRSKNYAELLASAVSSIIGSTKTVCEKGTHSFNTITNVPARCETAGKLAEECAFCGKERTTELPALGHTTQAEERTVIKPSTATRDGRESYICERCGEEYDSQTLPAYFHDTDPTYYYAEALDVCYERKIVSGMAKNLFYPDYELTRGMLVTLLYGCAGKPKATHAADFLDVEITQYYFESISWAQENKIVSGYGDGYFRPDDIVTRQDTAAILYRYIKLQQGELDEAGALSTFHDADKVYLYAREPVSWCVKHGIIYGMPDGTFEPELPTTRAQAVSLIYRLLKYLES